MKILIIHNNYTHKGGEEGVVEFQQRLFAERGHEVFIYNKKNDPSMSFKDKIKLFVEGFYSDKNYREIEHIVNQNNIDVAIVHNLFHKITPSVLVALRKMRVPSVMVLHNYRMLCPIGLLFRDGHICHSCPDSICLKEFNCFKYNCANSRATSLFMSVRSMWIRKSGIIRENITRLVCLTSFQQNLMARYGLTNSVVIPNAMIVDKDTNDVDSRAVKKEYFAFAGRLGYEKGFDLFLQIARMMPNARFRVAGDSKTIDFDVVIPDNVEMCGFLSGEELKDFFADAKALFIGSRWYEGFPLVCLEAFLHRTAIIAPKGRSFDGLVDDEINGYLYSIDDINAIVERVKHTDDDKWIDMGVAGREKVVEEYSSDVYYEKYIRLFEEIKKIGSL